MSLPEWLALAAEAKLRADVDDDEDLQRKMRGLDEYLDDYEAERGAFTDEELAHAGGNSGFPGRKRGGRMSGIVLDVGALHDIDIRPIYEADGRKAGELLGASGATDAIDASVALLAGPGDRILASDRDDLRRLCDAAGNKAVVIDC